MTTRFKNAYDKLVKAYYKNQLFAGSCTACAVGNLVGGAGWVKTVYLIHRGRHIFLDPDLYKGINYDTDKLIEMTGYTAWELGEIEQAFEDNTKIKATHLFNYNAQHLFNYNAQQLLEDQYNGLEAVVNVMLALDGVTEPQPALMDAFKEKLVTV